MHRLCWLVIVVFVTSLVPGCASTGKQAAATSGEIPEIAAVPAAGTKLSEFIIGAGDELEISVLRHDDMRKTPTVDRSGKIMYPLVGDVQAAGKSLFALRDELTEKLARYLVNPVVTVEIVTIKSRNTMVLGEVRSPGYFVLETDISVLEGLAKAGGYTDDANIGNVLLVRKKGNEKTEMHLDLEKALSGEDPAANVTIESGDIIYVPAKGIAKVSRFLNYITDILAPIVLVESGIVMWPLVKEALSGDSSSTESPAVSIPAPTK